MEVAENTLDWAIINDKTFDKDQLSTDELETLCSLTGKLQNVNDLRDFSSIFKDLKCIINFDRAYFYLFNSEHKSLRCEAIYGVSSEEIHNVDKNANRTYPEWVFKNKKPLILENKIKDIDIWEPCNTDNIFSTIMIPIIFKDQCSGTIVLESFQEQVFGQRETHLLTILANQIALILENAHLSNRIINSRQKYRNLFERSQLPIYFISIDGKLLEVNKAFIKLLGYTTNKETLTKNLLSHIVDREDCQTLKKKIIKNENFKKFEVQLKRNDGTIITGLITGTVVRNRYEKIIGYTGFIRDITKERELEEELFHAQKMQSIGTLTSEITHDFNNFLGGIMGYASLILANMPKTNPYFLDVQTILNTSRKAEALTSKLLTFSRKEKCQTKLISINSVVSEVLKMISTIFDKKIKIKSHFPSAIHSVKADSGQLQQALVNICINARDAMPQGGYFIVETENVTPEKQETQEQIKPFNYVRIRMRDTGTGMETDTLKKIFEPYFTTKEANKGSGLGLAIVNRIIKNHGGTIDVKSELGKGTTFEILLPARNE